MPDGTSRTLPAQTRSAAFVPATFDTEKRTMEVVWSTGAPVVRSDWWTGKRYIETLSLDPAHVDLSRMNGGAPVLLDHRMWDSDAVIGVIDKAWLAEGEGRALVRFSAVPEVQRYVTQIIEGVLRNISITYQARKYEITEEEGKDPTYRAVDWQPMELSFLPVGADQHASSRAAPAVREFPVEYVNRGQPAPANQERTDMSQSTATAGQPVPVDPNRAAAPATPPPSPAAVAGDAAARQAGIEAERKRSADIRARVRSVQLPETFADDLIARGMDGETVSNAIIDEVAKRGVQPSHPRAEVGHSSEDPSVVRSAMVDAICARAARSQPALKFEAKDQAREYARMPMLEMLAEFARASGHKVDRYARGAALWDQLVQIRALSTSDFPYLLANAGNKILGKAYELQAGTYVLVGARKVFNDFKAHSFIRSGDFPGLLEKGETGEFKYGSMGEAKNELTLATYGRVVGISRRIIVNDDMNAFADIPMKAGRRVADFNNATFWAQLALNSGVGPTIYEKNMPSGRPLFHTDHANYTSSGTAIDITNVGVGRAAMMKQTSIDGMKLNVEPKFLVTSPDKYTIAEQFCAVNVVAAQDSNANPFKGRLTPVGDANLSGNAWYLYADPGALETMVYGFLDGAEGPQLRSEEGFKTDGVEFLVYEDFVAGAYDFRGAYKNAGA